MLHYFVWKIQALDSNRKILYNDYWWIEIIYQWNSKEWKFFLFPFFDQNINSYKYFAFEELEQKIFFEQVQKIPWIWWKTAYHISTLPYNKIKEAINTFDINFFQSIQGIWNKTAKRILLELKTAFSEDDISKLNIDEKLYKNIVSTLKWFWYSQEKTKNLLKQYPWELKEENKNKIIKRLINNL